MADADAPGDPLANTIAPAPCTTDILKKPAIMKVTAITLRAGNAIMMDGKLLIVTRNEINQPGKGAAVAQIEARDARTGLKSNFRLRTQEGVEKADVYESDYQFLYSMDGVFHFMNNESYDQIEVPEDVIGDAAPWLQENMICRVATHEGTPLSVTLPQKVTLEIIEAEPAVKGQTQSASYKPAKLENGAAIMVPAHIAAGTRVVVSTADGSYVERARD